MISFRKILFVMGVNCFQLSFALLAPIFVSIIYDEPSQLRQFSIFAISLIISGVFATFVGRNHKPQHWNDSTTADQLNLREGYVITAITWIMLCILSAIPFYYFIGKDIVSFSEAIFESTSGITTSGATIFTDIENLPTTIKFYRQYLQWIGGFGIIVLAVAILPLLGMGSSSLFSSEKLYSYGNSRIAPKLRDTAIKLFKLYITLTTFCTLGYFYSGMNFFDALVHSFSTVSTGGFSTYNDSFMHFGVASQIVCMVFIFISSINFILHYHAIQGNALKIYFKNIEFRYFLYFIVCLTLFCTTFLLFDDKHAVAYDLFHSLFMSLSIVSSTGFISTDFFNWGFGLPFILLVASVVGGCTGSTTGGIKIIRFTLVLKQISLEVKKLVSPHSNLIIQTNESELNSKAVLSVVAFFALFILTTFATVILLMISGAELADAWYVALPCITNAGQSAGDFSASFSSLSDFQKLVLSVAMLLGRLEIFAILILLTPQFWRY